MTAPVLLSTLRARGVQLSVSAGRLRFRPATAVDADLRQAIETHRSGLVALLQAGPNEGHAGLVADALEAFPGAQVVDTVHVTAEAVPGALAALCALAVETYPGETIAGRLEACLLACQAVRLHPDATPKQQTMAVAVDALLERTPYPELVRLLGGREELP
ncbi:MAG TPA: hypothetical protein VGO93_28655 [Candidatus Xenobia bacterium]|jgi:hypothetical protein